MQLEITYQYTPQLAKTASRRFIRRQAAGSFLAIAVLPALGVAAYLSGIGSSCLLIISIGLPVLIASMWWSYHRRAADACKTLPDPRVTLLLEAESIGFRTSEHSSTLKWTRVKQVWRFPDVLLLFTYDTNAGYTAVPTKELGGEGTLHLLEKVREHGGKVS